MATEAAPVLIQQSSDLYCLMQFLGEIAGLSTGLLWAITSICFSEAGKRIGSFHVNKIRLLMAIAIYTAMLLLTSGYLFPSDLNGQQFFWLALSGFIGLVLGDGCGFRALVIIGPRLTTVMYALAPIIATVVAWLFLGEQLGWLDLVGIAVTICGIVWVVFEQRRKEKPTTPVWDHPDKGSFLFGILLGLGAATGQAVGLVMAKHAMFNAGGIVAPMEASFVRMVVAAASIWMFSIVRGQAVATFDSMKNRSAMTYCLGGAIAGPFLGVWMSLVAVSLIATGVAATLNATTPVMILPMVVLFYKEKLSARTIIGTIVTVIGVALLFLS